MKYFLFIIPFLFIGCVTKKGISFKYYQNCEENYGLYGTYYKECDYDIKFKKKKPLPPCLECN
ncbi:MAG: hypothetical protein ABGX25_00735 [Nautiliaceae bacterium]